MLQEAFDETAKTPSKERTRACFDILEKICNETSPFSTLLHMITKELKSSVYSTGVTSSKRAPYYENIPFCDLIEKINSVR
jgi:hypothetical protein